MLRQQSSRVLVTWEEGHERRFDGSDQSIQLPLGLGGEKDVAVSSESDWRRERGGAGAHHLNINRDNLTAAAASTTALDHYSPECIGRERSLKKIV